MNTYKEYHETVSKTAASTGTKPRIRDYVVIKMCDNALIVFLVFLILLFPAVGVLLEIKKIANVSPWFFEVGKLCFGIFVGLFAAKRK